MRYPLTQYAMKSFIPLCIYCLFSFSSISQKDYGFDIPWRAKSDECILEWFLDKLENDGDSAVYRLFECAGTDLDSIHWIYPTKLLSEISKQGKEYCSMKQYYTTNKSNEVSELKGENGINKLSHKTYNLFYTSTKEDGLIEFVLFEYY